VSEVSALDDKLLSLAIRQTLFADLSCSSKFAPVQKCTMPTSTEKYIYVSDNQAIQGVQFGEGFGHYPED
jgi:hypothetical protein